MKVRLKESCPYIKMVTVDGIFYKDKWSDVSSGTTIMEEMEIFKEEPVESEAELVKAEAPEIEEAKLEELVKIKGIGEKVIADIKRRYMSLDELIADLRNDKVSLRDDIVAKLKKGLL